MKIQCEKCGQQYDVEESCIGREVECECGHKWQARSPEVIKTMPYKGWIRDYSWIKVCPVCKKRYFVNYHKDKSKYFECSCGQLVKIDEPEKHLFWDMLHCFQMLVILILIIGVFIGIPAFLIAWGISSCSSTSNAKKTRGNPNQKINVTLTFWAYANKNGRAIIHGKTNLPPGTNLMFSIKDNATGQYCGQDKGAVLDDGSFQSHEMGPFAGLRPGTYTANVTMPVIMCQPKSVQGVLGSNGERMSGPLLKRMEIGNRIFISEDKTFSVGENAEQKQAERKKSIDFQTESTKKELQDYLQKLLLFKDDPDFAFYGFGRGGKYYKWLEGIEDLSRRANQNRDLPFHIRVAAGEIRQLGMEYMQSKGKETPYTAEILPEVKKAIGD